MNRIQNLAFAVTLVGALIPLLAQADVTHPREKEGRNMATHHSSTEIARGETVFEQNCSRCHNAPQGFPPQISGTILRHMRIRASLSAADERALLRFMNP
jgi:mono/diheme cytochrome c family protein